MDAELMRAVQIAAQCSDENGCPGCADGLKSALTATVAEYRKRRADGLFVFPVKLGVGATVDGSRYWFIQRSNTSFTCQERAERVAAALNAYYGYDAQGGDLLEGMGV